MGTLVVVLQYVNREWSFLNEDGVNPIKTKGQKQNNVKKGKHHFRELYSRWEDRFFFFFFFVFCCCVETIGMWKTICH